MYDNPLTRLLATPLPSKYKQRTGYYKPSTEEIDHVYDLLNIYIFESRLKKPSLAVRRMRRCWGLCRGYDEPTLITEIDLHQNLFCIQWLVLILAHEMAHQYQWEHRGAVRISANKPAYMSHGPSFFEFRLKLNDHGIALKTVYSSIKWFKHQDLLRV